MGRGSGQDERGVSVAPEAALYGRFRRKPTPSPNAAIRIEVKQKELEPFCQCFTDGHTSELFADKLPKLGEKLGVELIAIWEGRDDLGFHGDAELFVIDRQLKLRDIPDRLHEWLYGVDPRPLPPTLTVRAPSRRTRKIEWRELAPSNGIRRESPREPVRPNRFGV